MVEDWCGEPGAQVEHRVAQQVGCLGIAGSEAGGEVELRDQRRTGHLDIGLGSSQTRFGAGDIRASSKQLARHAGGDAGADQPVEGLLLQIQRLHGLAEQGRQGHQRFIGLLPVERQLPLLAGHHPLLLGQFQSGR
ncbi:hypothetical protein D3C80_1633380 [compost metagenome]